MDMLVRSLPPMNIQDKRKFGDKNYQRQCGKTLTFGLLVANHEWFPWQNTFCPKAHKKYSGNAAEFLLDRS